MIGETLGSYRIISEIGSGGMGVVFMAEHTLIGRKAAVKLLRQDVSGDNVERFFNEAKAAAKLHHPGLVDVFDFGHHTDGRAYIVMEYLAGESLAERLEHDPRLPVPIACSIARSVAMALEVAHQQGIVHRDLKPGNVFLVPDREAAAGVRTKVLDFGIAKLVREREPGGVNTASGVVIGTPRYMSPEQCKNAKSVDGRSDIYSLGCILYEMLLGVAPFDYDSWAELVGAHIYEVPAKPSEIDPNIPEEVETLVTKMLEKDPADRFSSMQQLSESLEVVLRSHGAGPVRLTPTGRLSTPPRGMRKVQTGQDPTLPAAGAIKAAAATAPTLAPAPAPTTGQQLPPAVAAPAVPTARKPPYAAVALGVVGIGALAGAAAVVLRKGNHQTSDEPTYVVVDQRGTADKPIAVATPDAAEAPLDATEAAGMAVDAGVRGTPPIDKKPPSGEPDIDQLTRSFARQGAAINTCFKQNPTKFEGQVSVRLQVNRDGKVTSAELVPSSVGGTPLGTCVVEVAKRASFGPQPKSVAFKVPLLTLEN